MMFTKIWERHFLWEVLKVFFLLIASFYTLYILFDYSSRSSTFQYLGLSHRDLVFYYLFTFIQRMDILIPFALLIAFIRIMIHINTQNELVALLTGGLPAKVILRPLLIIGCVFTAIIYLNTEFFLPYAVQELHKIEDAHFIKEKSEQNGLVHSVLLDDQTAIVYQKYDLTQEAFFDAYWLRSIDNIYHMKYLLLKDPANNNLPVGKFVDHLSRNEKGEMVHQASYETLPFLDMKFNTQNLAATLVPPSDQSLSRLWSQFPSFKNREVLTDKKAAIMTAFYRKLAIPWLCLLVLIAPAPFCLKITRNLPVFFIYVCSMFGLVSLYLMMNAALIVGQSQVVSPFAAIGIPMIGIGTFFTWRFLWKPLT